MKKGLFFLACAMCARIALAEEPMQPVPADSTLRHYLQLSIGDSYVNQWCNRPMAYGDVRPDEGAIDWFGPDVYSGQTVYVPTFSLTYYYAIKPWLHVGGEVYYSGRYTEVRDRVPDEQLGTAGVSNLSVLPSIRFQYYDRENIGLYSGVSAGLHILMAHGDQLYDGENPVNTLAYRLAFQVTALGMRFGNRVYGMMEIGFGHKGICTIGIGTRF